MEDDPRIKFTLEDGSNIEATRENSSVYTFLGKAAMYNHIFIVIDDENALYTFCDSPHYIDVISFMVDNSYPMHLNLLEAQDCDREAYEKYVDSASWDLGDYPPEEWANN